MVAVQKSERLLKLLIMLLVQQRYVSKERVRELLYPGSGDEAFERMFERDKDDLRALGVPIEVGSLDAYFEDEPGYRVRADEAQLPQIELTADEAHVVGLATKVAWTGSIYTYPWLQNNTAVVPNTWTQLQGNLVIPAGCAVSDVAIFFEGTTAGSDVFVDDVSVTPL